MCWPGCPVPWFVCDKLPVCEFVWMKYKSVNPLRGTHTCICKIYPSGFLGAFRLCAPPCVCVRVCASICTLVFVGCVDSEACSFLFARGLKKHVALARERCDMSPLKATWPAWLQAGITIKQNLNPNQQSGNIKPIYVHTGFYANAKIPDIFSCVTCNSNTFLCTREHLAFSKIFVPIEY